MQINNEEHFIIVLRRELNEAPEHKSIYGQENVENGSLSSSWHCGAEMCVRTGVFDFLDLLFPVGLHWLESIEL
jgi:hypothetical protein